MLAAIYAESVKLVFFKGVKLIFVDA